MNKSYHSKSAKSKYVIINMGKLLAGLIILVTVIAKSFPLYTAGVVHAAIITYTYDSLNRLTKVDYGNNVTITYAYDASGNRLTLVSTPSDTTPPTTPLVTDDGSYTTNLSQLHAVWVSNDPESGIAEYQYAIGTTPLGTDVAGWISTGTDTSVTHTGLSLLDGITSDLLTSWNLL